MKPIFSLIGGVVFLAALLQTSALKDTAPEGPPPFALVELFTSQGCSSCPPADAQLERLVERAEQTGEQIIALSFHVDYWNYLGWSDPYSQKAFSNRQYRYSGYLNAGVYTPQMVVNGQTEFIGSRRNEADAAVNAALKATPVLGLEASFSVSGQAVTAQYALDQLPEDAILLAAISEKQVATSVKRGENRGRDLTHVGVVRDFYRDNLTDKAGEITLQLPADIGTYSVVVYVQDGKSGAILGAAVAGTNA